ncbi:unnamed protein product [Macrosiphum euphorbiae]|uniref:Uncharacterized protein n=1 Tax=Macrosiphum euphorbiae TaxID=13131 RepID=A0AAV0YBR8_9HEMI|nr:unnamed protein product [Macrosiphum euphorbiae]
MDHDTNQNLLHKRKQISRTPDNIVKKKDLKFPAVPTNIDTNSSLDAAAKATSYTYKLVQGLEYYQEDYIELCLAKVVKDKNKYARPCLTSPRSEFSSSLEIPLEFSAILEALF